jgi:hypothetical protein
VEVGVDVFVGEGVEEAVFVVVGVGGFSVEIKYSTYSIGAADARPSYASAVRWPVPPIKITMEFPAVHPGRYTISCMRAEIFGVRWSNPA